MAYRKKTLRSMLPTTRKVARLIGELGSVEKRLKNIIPELQRIELDSKALEAAKAKNIQDAHRELASITTLAQMRYKEIRNAEAINHTLQVITDHALRARQLLT